jgi:hypothetical protein
VWATAADPGLRDGPAGDLVGVTRQVVDWLMADGARSSLAEPWSRSIRVKGRQIEIQSILQFQSSAT